MRTITQELQEKISPNEALEILQAGNKRFIQNLKVNRNFLEQVNITRDGQWPFAVVLSCIDSRTSAELIFDQGLGDVFSIRIAGNIINDDILGSMEFACKVAGSKFVLVLGHKKCGAIKGACDGVKLGHLSVLLSKIEPAVQEETTTVKDRNSGNEEFLQNVARIHVKRVVKEVLNRSTILKEMVDEGKIGIGGAMYDVATGEVEFYEDTIIINPAERTSRVASPGGEVEQPTL
jgi:carbonic anhydrase